MIRTTQQETAKRPWHTMAVSPVVTYTAGSQSQAKPVSSPLKTLATTSGQTSSNGTPRPVPAPAAALATMDLAEQMNEEEKRKYVKG